MLALRGCSAGETPALPGGVPLALE